MPDEVVEISESDVGTRRICYRPSPDDPQYVVVVDRGVSAGYVQSQTDWRTTDELRAYAQMLLDAVEWLET